MVPVKRKTPIPNENKKMIRGFCAAAAAAVILLAGPAAAQDSTRYVGGSGKPDVQVDLGAIYGRGYGERKLLMPNSDLEGPVQLRPPGSSGEKLTLRKPGSMAEPAPSGRSMAAKPPEPVTTPPAPPKAPPKMAAEPPPPKTKKRLPVKTEPLPPEGDTAEAPEPPPAPPAPPEGGETAASKGTAETTAEDIKEKTDSAMAPPPPPPPANGMAADSGDIPPPPPPPPPAPDETAAAESPAPSQVAALPTEKAVMGGETTPVSFAAGSAVLEDSAKETLGAVAKSLTGDDGLRLQIVAYAVGEDDNASQARRLSLSRALAVRSYLIDQGIRSTRMDVRALGNKFDSGPGDRVDLVIVNQ